MATIKDTGEKDSDANNKRQMLTSEEPVLTNSLHDGHNDLSPSNATSTNNSFLDSHKASYEDLIKNPFVLRKSRSSSASPPESRIGNLSNQSIGYLLGSSSASPNEHDHSYCQLRLYNSFFDTPPTTNSVEEFDDDMSILDMSLSLAWEELLSDEITESSHSVKNSVSSFTDMSQVSRISAGDERQKRYRYPKSQLCHCPEMMTFGMTDLWAHKCNSALDCYDNTGSASSQNEYHQSKNFPLANNDFADDNNEHKCYGSPDFEPSSTDSLVPHDDCTAPSEKKVLPLITRTEAPCSYNFADSNTPISNPSVNGTHPPFSYCNHLLKTKLSDDFTRTRGHSTSEGVSPQANHSQFDSRRWYSLGSLCDDDHCSPNDVIKHDYAHTHGHDRVRVDLDLPPEPFNDTGYTSTADTDSPVKDDDEVENESYDADCESDHDVGENLELVLVNGEMGEIDNVGEVQRSRTSIGEAVLIDKYAMQEWKGETIVAETMRKVCLIFL